ncbi:PREDICTED: cephalotocin receptor 2-like [Nicrophorus vespilloides]|uniref:Cephalotocin receptor 2-like n=1 Tax=Nicrophorus vespilloides TaxID=110193 RepID=A0ABM1NJ56_NICVS|nr:PREDICTED: cephalotocin receptor 2-like [Nicrophorus vespilloides]
MHLRRSDISNIERARIRTLRMTITIVVVFVICWTPYVVMTLWYMFDRNSAEQVPSWLQDTLFMMAVANSCMNPLVYGSYAINFRKELSRCCCCCCHTNSPEHRPKGQRITAGQGVRLPKKLLKCGRALQAAAGSGATRSTAMIHGVITNKSQTNRPENHYEGLLPKKTDRPPSVGQISFVSENSSTKGYHRPSFHSEPGPCSDRMEDICKATRHKSEASVPTEPL